MSDTQAGDVLRLDPPRIAGADQAGDVVADGLRVPDRPGPDLRAPEPAAREGPPGDPSARARLEPQAGPLSKAERRRRREMALRAWI